MRFSNDGRTLGVQLSDKQGGWKSSTTTGLQVYVGSNNSREIRISWASLTGMGIPAAFNWLAYAENNSFGAADYRYDLVPANEAAVASNGGTTPGFSYYYTTANTATAIGLGVFNLRSYTFIDQGSNNSFGSIDVWDFTMNTAGLQVSQGSTGGTWNISGSLVVGAGAIYFGSGTSNFGGTNVGNIRVTGGILSMDQSTRPIVVREDVVLTGGQFILGAAGNNVSDPAASSNLEVGRDFRVDNGTYTPGTFQANSRRVTFTGNNATHNVVSSTAYQIPFSFVTLNSPGGTLTLGSNVIVQSALDFAQGNLLTGSNTLLLATDAVLNNESAASHIIGQVQSVKTLTGGGSGTYTFGNIGLSLTPQNSSSTAGTLTVTRTTGTAASGVSSQ